MKRCRECKAPEEEQGSDYDPDCEDCWHRWHNENYGADCCNMGPAPELEDYGPLTLLASSRRTRPSRSSQEG